MNTGEAALELTGMPAVQITGTHASDFDVIIQPDSSIAPGESTSFTVQFNPSVIGPHSATISIASSDSDENPYTFDIRGTGARTTYLPVVLRQ